ncbi:hypothetical protein [Anatilimnocola floriformis]|uniref:hypothetical protein n=1 Tax=Anatilimnocola floriformis TaxID=2948575 RepID=UPI0020C1E1F0|nr:hypothetical protein [Anatilimnocola floriformis]
MKVSWFRSMLVLGLLVTGSWASAQDAAPALPDDIATLVKQLDAESFGDRQAASKKLAAELEKAIPALEKAALSDSRETSMRAFEILKGHFDKGEAGVKDAAKQALERISKADLGAASRRASEALAPPPVVPQNVPANARMPIAVGGGGIRIAAARVAIAGGIGGGVETRIKVEDGVKTTEIKDKDRKVKIVEDGDKSLQLEVTETKDGKEETKKYDVKNAEELKSKHAEAHKIYEQYAAKGVEVKMGGIGFAPAGAIPVLPAFPDAVPVPLPARAVPLMPIAPAFAPVPDKKLVEGLESLQKALAEADASLKDAAKKSGDTDQLKKAQQQLEDLKKQLESLRSSLK